MKDVVTLIVPAKEKELPVVRLTTAGIASRFKMDWETMEDVKTAVYEACYAMTMQKWAPEEIRIDFSLAENFTATVAALGEKTETLCRIPELKLCKAVLEAMIPFVQIELEDDCITSIRLSR